ncbi:putative uncharacterized protein C5orf58 homolog isoform X1 [Sapajus apella]|uniref:Uncharacterized protein n=1 Tax=Sapajus apella TaxID=9515 RepID=A0A6J3FRZ9_SAPAP|nr:putative uncharacterized protein C5orf58 homolog isoform X1 [Sapajus apella]
MRGTEEGKGKQRRDADRRGEPDSSTFFRSGSEVREIGEILRAQEKVEEKIDLKMGDTSVTDHKLHVEKIIKNINTISLELKKIKELSQLLLCDLTLHFNHPMKTENLTEAERNDPLFEEAKISDVSHVSNSFSI